MDETGRGLVIVGTGLAGYGAAREFRKASASAPLTILTADDGASYSKPQLSAAMGSGKSPDQLVQKDALAMAKDLSAQILTLQTIVDADAAGGILRTAEGREVAFDRLVLAVGAKARKPALRLSAGAEIHSVNDLAQYKRFRLQAEKGKRLAILGAGLIGCEFAHDFSQAGYRVTIIGTGPTPLAGLVPSGVGRALQAALSRLGVEWKLNQSLEAIERTGRGLQGILRDGGTIEADVFLSAIGFEPNLELAQKLGLRTGRGISVDMSLRTSHPDIFALGDCAEIGGRWLPFVLPLNLACKTLGLVLAGKPSSVLFPFLPVLIKTPTFPISVLPPPPGMSGEWREVSDAEGIQASFHDSLGKLAGFALGGKASLERNEWIRRMTAEALAP